MWCLGSVKPELVDSNHTPTMCPVKTSFFEFGYWLFLWSVNQVLYSIMQTSAYLFLNKTVYIHCKLWLSCILLNENELEKWQSTCLTRPQHKARAQAEVIPKLNQK